MGNNLHSMLDLVNIDRGLNRGAWVEIPLLSTNNTCLACRFAAYEGTLLPSQQDLPFRRNSREASHEQIHVFSPPCMRVQNRLDFALT
jgi:hypothetical protein